MVGRPGSRHYQRPAQRRSVDRPSRQRIPRRPQAKPAAATTLGAMKRRNLLGLGALGLLGGWALRPSDLGQPHAPYFAALNQLLRRAGAGLPRLVAKSLASTGLLDYLAKKLGTQRFMVFHQPHINQLAVSFPQSDLLLGKPLPSAAALSFYQQLPQGSGFVPAEQLTWLID